MPANLYGIGDNFDLEQSHVLAALIRKIHLAKLLSENKQKEVFANLKIKSQTEAQAYLVAKLLSENKQKEVFANLKIKTQTEAQAYLEKFGICSNSSRDMGHR